MKTVALLMVLLSGLACGAVLEYPAPGNLDLDEGTMEFWFTPTRELYPPMGDRKFVGVFSLFSLDMPEQFHAGCGWGQKAEGATLFVSMSAPGRDKALLPVGTHVKGWKAGEAHHVAFTWKGRDMRIYVDGRPGGERMQSVPFSGGIAQARLLVGGVEGRSAGIILHAVRTSSVARTEAMLRNAQPEPDLYSLLVDRFDRPGKTQAEQISGLSGEKGATVSKDAQFVQAPKPGLAL